MFSYSSKLHTLGSPWPSFLKWRFPVWFVYFTWKSFCSTLTSKWTVYLPLFKCNRKCKEKKVFQKLSMHLSKKHKKERKIKLWNFKYPHLFSLRFLYNIFTKKSFPCSGILREKWILYLLQWNKQNIFEVKVRSSLYLDSTLNVFCLKYGLLQCCNYSLQICNRKLLQLVKIKPMTTPQIAWH